MGIGGRCGISYRWCCSRIEGVGNEYDVPYRWVRGGVQEGKWGGAKEEEEKAIWTGVERGKKGAAGSMIYP